MQHSHLSASEFYITRLCYTKYESSSLILILQSNNNLFKLVIKHVLIIYDSTIVTFECNIKCFQKVFCPSFACKLTKNGQSETDSKTFNNSYSMQMKVAEPSFKKPTKFRYEFVMNTKISFSALIPWQWWKTVQKKLILSHCCSSICTKFPSYLVA